MAKQKDEDKDTTPICEATQAGKGVISVPIVDNAQPYGFGVGRFMEPLKTIDQKTLTDKERAEFDVD